jgi:hypothetical protein
MTGSRERIEERSARPGALPWASFALLLALAAVARAPALRTDFWLDEIWSLEGFARRARSVADVFVGEGFRHDNNHPLNTLWLHALGERSGWIAYRALALASGLATVAAAIVFAGRRGRLAGIAAGILVSLSFLQVVYSTEARGYAPALAFALLAVLALERALDTGRAGPALAYAACTLGGLFAHPTFVFLYPGALAWSAARCLRAPRAMRVRVSRFVGLHAVPLAALWAVQHWIVRGAARGGGPPWTWAEVADDALAWTLGFPIRTVPAALSLAACALVLVLELRALARENDDRWLLHLGVIVVAPVLTLALFGRTYLFARYFLLPLSFFLLVLASALARLARRPRSGKLAAALLLLAFAAGNAAHLAPFYDHGRGGASAAVRQMLADSPPGEIVVSGSPVDVWTEAPLAFYARHIDPARAVRYVERASVRPAGVGLDWFVEQSYAREPPAPETTIRFAGQPFELAATYPAYGPSGIAWFLYRRQR